MKMRYDVNKNQWEIGYYENTEFIILFVLKGNYYE